MVSLAAAKFDSDTDENDEDYDAKEDEANESDHEEGDAKRKNKKNKVKASTEIEEQERLRQVENAWAELCAESTAEVERRPPRRQQVAIPGEFQRRHPRPPKSCTKSSIWAELKKYNNVVADDAPPAAKPAELKRRVRSAGDPPVCPARPNVKAADKPTSGMVVLEEKLQFAGESVVVRRTVARGSKEEKKRLEEQSKKRKRELGGQLSMLDSYLGALKDKPKTVSAVDKSQKDWRSFTDQEGLEADLAKDKRAGAMDRQAFLKRTDARQQEELRAARMAKRRRKPEGGT
eukprot:gnl/MRDRNA2_/MRDRNA2_62023_c0_seq1.p1 gnl/MRDRNA2_/MRDRNA2_62023_c0~~gnl/MRDRNA2_/MRDRNA2_62023_c0_seq1.p1  ORF type:complete len:290 (+),score=79.69 gnl/MRDRNA2_/MRDRNA2_62023_c0_seq1:80-949(+)